MRPSPPATWSAASRSLRYRVLVLAEKPARLFEASGDALVEVRTGGFPIVVEGGRGEPLESGGYPVHTSHSDEQERQFFVASIGRWGQQAPVSHCPSSSSSWVWNATPCTSRR